MMKSTVRFDTIIGLTEFIRQRDSDRCIFS